MSLKKPACIIKKPEHITKTWAHTIINAHQKRDEKCIEINAIDITDIDVGTTTRIRVHVDHNVEQALPKHWFIKLPSLSWRAKAITALPRLLPTEIRFYQELAPQIPLALPQAIAAHNHPLYGSTLVMSDVAEFGAQPGQAGDALSADQAMQVVEKLANFHGAFMVKANQDNHLGWLAGSVRQLEDTLGSALAVPLMQRGLRLAGDIIPPGLRQPALQYARNRRQVMRFFDTNTPTLIHHDCHPGNLFWHDGEPGFLDWQMVRLGEAISDVSYFLATALPPETRRECELAAVKKYHKLMQENGGAAISFDHLCERYRAHLAYPFEAMVLTLAVGGLMQLEGNLEMIKRSVAAVKDNQSFSILANKVY